MSAPMTLELATSMLALSEALRAKLVEEKAALLAMPSPLFQPRSSSLDCRQFEREAFAKGLHHAAISGGRRA